uniref:Ribosomal protein L7/L12 n=1 Tax=Streptomyces sp. NBC_00003 TaxID=2903608 RepID=A0AAU2VHL8_9ACTN
MRRSPKPHLTPTLSLQHGRLRDLERKVDLLLDHLGVEEPPILGMERVHELLRQGKKIEAIKVYRQLTGEGLKESKDAVERMS